MNGSEVIDSSWADLQPYILIEIHPDGLAIASAQCLRAMACGPMGKLGSDHTTSPSPDRRPWKDGELGLRPPVSVILDCVDEFCACA